MLARRRCPRDIVVGVLMVVVAVGFFVVRHQRGLRSQRAEPLRAPPPPPERQRPSTAIVALPSTTAATSIAIEDGAFIFPARTKGVIVNLGSHADPINPPPDDPRIAVLAVEPDPATISRIKRKDRRFVLAAAVAGTAGLATMHRYNNGVSSSLSKMAHDFFNPRPAPNVDEWKGPQGSPFFVSVVTLEHILHAIPKNIDVLYIKTDMQGYDLDGIKSAGPSLRRVYKIMSEVALSGVRRYLTAPPNDFNLDWEPFMRARWGGVFELAALNFQNATRNAHAAGGATRKIPETKEEFEKLDKSLLGGIHGQEGDVVWRNAEWRPRHDWGGLEKLWKWLDACSHCNEAGTYDVRSGHGLRVT